MENCSLFYFVYIFYALLVGCFITSGNGDSLHNISNSSIKSFCYGKQGIVSCYTNSNTITTYTILILEISYETNCSSSCQVEICRGQCKQFTLPKSWKNYYYYDALSGKEGSSQFTAQSIHCTETNTFTNWVHIEYQCIQNLEIMNFCGLHTWKRNDIVYLKYEHEETVFLPKDCYCKASASSSRSLNVYAVDIRFQDHVKGTDGHCDTLQNSFLTLSDDSNNKTFSCVNNHTKGSFETMFSSSNATLSIQLHVDGHPQMIWIAISANDDELVDVVCNNEVLSFYSTSEASSYVTTSKDTSVTDVSKTMVATQTTASNTHFHSTFMPTTDKTVSSNILIAENNTINRTKGTELITTNLETSSIRTSTIRKIIISSTTDKTDKTITRSLKKNTIDPAIITLIVAGILIVILVITGVVIGKTRNRNRRLENRYQQDIRPVQMRDIDPNRTRRNNQYERSVDLELSLKSTTVGKTVQSENTHTETSRFEDTTVMYSSVHKSHDRAYNKIYPVVPSDGNSNLSDTKITYDHIPSSTEDGLYSKINFQQNSNNRHPSRNHNTEINQPDDVALAKERSNSSESYHVSPYVDEVVRHGMESERDAKRRSSSSVDFERSINDLVNHANVWAADDNKK